MKSLTSLVPPIMKVVMHLLQNGKEVEARDILISLTDIADRESSLFKPGFKEHTYMLLQVGNNNNGAGNFDHETRQSALELVNNVIEGRPALIRKDAALMQLLCETLLGMLLSIEDTEEWHKAIEEQDLDDGAPVADSMLTASHHSSAGWSFERTGDVQAKTRCTSMRCKAWIASRGRSEASACSRPSRHSSTSGPRTATGRSGTRRC